MKEQTGISQVVRRCTSEGTYEQITEAQRGGTQLKSLVHLSMTSSGNPQTHQLLEYKVGV